MPRKQVICTAKGNYGVNSLETGLQSSDGSGIIKQRIASGQYSTKLSHQHYLKHIEGTKQYNDYAAARAAKGHTPQGRLTISETEAQAIINKYAGTGDPYIEKSGNIGKTEYVDCDVIIGEYYENGTYYKTNRAAIHYGTRSAHIVPVKPISRGELKR